MRRKGSRWAARAGSSGATPTPTARRGRSRRQRARAAEGADDEEEGPALGGARGLKLGDGYKYGRSGAV